MQSLLPKDTLYRTYFKLVINNQCLTYDQTITGCYGFLYNKPWADPEGGTGGPDPPPSLKNYKNKAVLAILVRIPWKSAQSYQASIQCWTIISTPAKRHLNGVSLAGRWWPAYSGIWISPPLINGRTLNVVKLGPPLTNFHGSAHASNAMKAKNYTERNF